MHDNPNPQQQMAILNALCRYLHLWLEEAENPVIRERAMGLVVGYLRAVRELFPHSRWTQDLSLDFIETMNYIREV